MMVTDVMKSEIATLEDALENAMFENLPEMVSNFIIRNPMYKQYLGKIADTLFLFMDPETGEIDGAAAHEALQLKFPVLTKWVSVPQEHFKIRDEINGVSEILAGRSVL